MTTLTGSQTVSSHQHEELGATRPKALNSKCDQIRR